MEKSYYMPEWAEFLQSEFFPDHEVDGKIRARGEDFDDVWTLVADPATATFTKVNGWPQN